MNVLISIAVGSVIGFLGNIAVAVIQIKSNTQKIVFLLNEINKRLEKNNDKL